MKDSNDWENLPRLLVGLKTARRVLEKEDWERMVRKAGQAGRQAVLLECASRVSETGFKLGDVEMVAEVMWWMQQRAANVKWNLKGTAKALNMAEQVMMLLESDKHVGRAGLGKLDPRQRPEVVGILLQLAAARAVKHQGGKDTDGKVKSYAQRLKHTMDKEIVMDVAGGWHARNLLLCRIVPILHGMKMAVGVLEPGSDISRWMGDRMQGVEEVVSENFEIVLKEMREGAMPRGVACYRELMTEES